MKNNWLGPVFVGCAALLLATDALFRMPAVSALDAKLIVAIEHFIGLIVLCPIVLFHTPSRDNLMRLNFRAWAAALFI